jgi:TolB protein
MQVFYTVRSGDSLYQIATRWELPVDSLIAANHLLPPYTIYIGQQLSIPPGVNVSQIKKGDTLFQLSQFYGVPQAVIVEENALQPPYMIHPGQLLKIPPGVPYYIVFPGDTLYQIAKRFNVVVGGTINPEPIRLVNQLKTDVIYPGMKLKIPYSPPLVSGLIAYTSNQGGHDDIWLYNPSSGKSVQLTNGLGDRFSVPVWSLDSKNIAFVGKNAILYVINLDSGNIAKIDQFEEGEGVHLDWSPNNQQLAYIKDANIVLYDISTHQVDRINAPDATDVEWFPSGEELLFQAPDSSGFSQLFRIHKTGNDKRVVTRNTEGRLNNVRLSPDGAFALYTTPGASISIIHTVDISTGMTSEVKGGPLAKNYFPEWSPDSKNIAYSATAFEDRGYFSLIRTSGRKGENDRTWAISDCFATPITWSPDGRKIAYLSGCNEQGIASEMWVVDIKHPAPIRLVEGVQITSLQWSPKQNSDRWKTYISDVYKVRLTYPASWKQVGDERFEGLDGFFQIAAISSSSNIDEVCHNEAFHQLMPYGSQPTINKSKIQFQDACFIYPSQDQPQEMKGQAALIVKYPDPIQIQGTIYHYFILWADIDHINKIGSTLNFI